MQSTEVVITGVGVVCPLGIGCPALWAAFEAGQSGIRRVRAFDPSQLPVQIAGEVLNFEPKLFVANRKSLKVMARDAQLGLAAARLAACDARMETGQVDPDRFGVVLGADRICSPIDESESTYRPCMVGDEFDFRLWGSKAMAASYPLGFLRVLPNMTASHVSIAHDARGPNNTIHHADLSSLMAVGEAASVIGRGTADVMLAGGASSQLNLFDYVRRCRLGILSPRQDDPARVMRPFDAGRDGQVWGEGAAVFVLESRRHAAARKAQILARVGGWASAAEPSVPGQPIQATALRRAMRLALDRAGLSANRLGHVNAHGLSTQVSDRLEAAALHDVVGRIPVTAPRSFFGNLGAAAGAVEMAVSVLALGQSRVPPTCNYEHPDPACPVQVVHGESIVSSRPSALTINWTRTGQAAAMVLVAD